MTGLFFHRAWIVAISPLVWVFAAIAHIVTAPLAATEDVYLGIKKHWNDR